jgi:uncharacterized repeat protein (TIGR01451 family)
VSEANETFSVNLASAVNATIATAAGTGTILDDDTSPSLSINSVSQPEGNSGTSSMIFTVTLSPASANTVIVSYATANGSATAGSDYTSTTGTLTFAPGITSQTIAVPVIGDTSNEADETFTIALASPANATILAGTGTGTIQDDDGVSLLSIDSVSQAEGNSGTTAMTFTVTLSPPSSGTVTVNYATANGSATGGSDFTPVNGTLTFAPGTLSMTVSVPIIGDSVNEPNETFTLVLSSPANAVISTAIGAGTIVNDDGGNTDVSIVQAAPSTAFALQSVTFTLTVSNNGPNTADNVVVTDMLPAGSTFVSATPSQGSCTGQPTVTCNLGAILNGASATIAVIVTPTALGPATNTATVSSAPQVDPNSANNASTASVTVQPTAPIPMMGGFLLMLLAGMLGGIGAWFALPQRPLA